MARALVPDYFTFHEDIKKTLETCTVDVIELYQHLTEPMEAIHHAIVQCMTVTLSELKKILELDDLNLESAYFCSFGAAVLHQETSDDENAWAALDEAHCITGSRRKRRKHGLKWDLLADVLQEIEKDRRHSRLVCQLAVQNSSARGSALSKIGHILNWYLQSKMNLHDVSQYNFAVIGGNIPGVPAIVSNTVIQKPSPAAMYSNYLVYQILTEAGVPASAIQGCPQAISHTNFAALHFTGSTFIFKKLWKDVAANLDKYKGYPRIVGETGAKNFHVIHKSADVRSVVLHSIRGDFEYQGGHTIAKITVGLPSDFNNFMGPARGRPGCDKVYVCDPNNEKTLEVIDNTSPHALTGSIFAVERKVLLIATNKLCNASSNDEKCTGAVVGQQPFGVARASGTNDKAGSISIFYRFISARSVKEDFVSLEDVQHPSDLI
ncbi:1-pyrroline-5-carboxylate dehydrogenase [Suillus subluteus]|nr:1-pyrroline-5-carboxylate dehydrogenase [Suillus subluteus]